MKAWPLVCITAWASSWVRALIRERISRQTRARTSGPAARQAAVPAFIAGSRTSRSACGYSTPSSGPYGETSPPTQPSVPGCSQVEPGAQSCVEGGLALGRTQAARGAAFAVRLRVLGVRRPVRAGTDHVEGLVERGPVGLGQLLGVSAEAMADQLLIEPGGDVRTELE